MAKENLMRANFKLTLIGAAAISVLALAACETPPAEDRAPAPSAEAPAPPPPPPPINERPTDLVAAGLGIPEQVFIDCFSGVSPDPGKDPSGAQQHSNKAILLPCLQAENPAITNDMLDSVMDKYRPEGPMPKH